MNKFPAAHHAVSYSRCKMSNIPDPARLCKPGVLSVAVWPDPIASRRKSRAALSIAFAFCDTLRSQDFLLVFNPDSAFQPTERALCVGAGWASRIELVATDDRKFAMGAAANGNLDQWEP